jgi:hypothetical protein
VQDLRTAFELKEEVPGKEAVDRIELELERGDEGEVPAAAPQRPEQIRLVVLIDAQLLPGRGDDLDRGDAVGLEPLVAGLPADSPAQRVAGDVDLRRGTVQRREPELGRLRDDVPPARAGLDPRGPGVGVNRDLLHPAEAHQQVSLERAHRRRVVRGALDVEEEPSSRAARTMAAVSSALLGCATASGCWSMTRLNE